MQNEPIEVTLRVTAVLENLGVPYLIGGSLASTLHGMIRTTQDSDIIAEMHPEHIRPFVSSLENDFFIDEEMIANAVQRDSSFNILHRETMFKVDIFIPYPRSFQQSQLARPTTRLRTRYQNECNFCQRRRYHPFQTRMVSYGRRNIRKTMARYSRHFKDQGRRSRP